ncbi:MAG: iron-sulfur cluster carrier protein ApbC [Blastocatellia bacterium]|nr:iron-sulfur cluster carrier protein ApbC [Blastocatellia bacterium]MBL8195042.1 iron-sulfur cluster carrier protein ApbC [Blastocatellia bacterium]MBN8723423.1 iron-sulfur cluster carrier protein ApbC [Acidobacteriota bacterium]
MSEKITEQQVLEALKSVKEPKLKKDIVSLNFVKDVRICGGIIGFRLVVATPSQTLQQELEEQARQAVLKVPGAQRAEIRTELDVPKGKAIGDRESVVGVKNIIAVSSGKGGVGKSTVAVNLAVALASMGAKVGLLDTDIYGPNVPIMLGSIEEPKVRGKKILPREAYNVKFMSVGLLNRGDQAVVWRGPMLHRLIEQFLRDVDWSELDYLLVDMPPGTGDVQLSLAQLVPVSGAVLVTTPQEVALADVRKAHNMFQQVGVDVVGIVENMSYFTCPNCLEKHEIFGSGGGEELAEKFGVTLLGKIPISLGIREGGDLGVPIVAGAPDSPQAHAFCQAAEALATELNIRALKPTRLPILNFD